MDKLRVLLTGAGLAMVLGVLIMWLGVASAQGLGAFVLALGLGGAFGALVLGKVSSLTGRVNAHLVVTGVIVALVGVALRGFGVGAELLGVALSTWLLGFGLGAIFADRFWSAYHN